MSHKINAKISELYGIVNSLQLVHCSFVITLRFCMCTCINAYTCTCRSSGGLSTVLVDLISAKVPWHLAITRLPTACNLHTVSGFIYSHSH